MLLLFPSVLLVSIGRKKNHKELIAKIYKQLMQLNNETINDPIKNGPKKLMDISPKKTYRCLTNT